MTVGAVAALWRYPVKSMRGEMLSEARISERGLEGDRAMALIDRETGKVASAKHPRLWAGLLACQASLQRDHRCVGLPVVRITLPDGQEIVTGRDDVDRWLSDFLGRAVTLSAAPLARAETEREYPQVDGLPVSGMFFSAEIGLGAPPGTFFDYAPIHLVTTSTLARLKAVAPENDFDVRRFRPNLVVATDGLEGFVENDWVGQTLAVGDSVRLRVTDPTPRCVVTTLPQPGLSRDVDVLRTVAAHNRPAIPTLGDVKWPSAGVYAIVERGGCVREGDEVW